MVTRIDQTAVMIVGGHRDGEIVPYMGPRMYEPVPPPVRRYIANPDVLPTAEPVHEVREYDLHLWSDRSGPTEGRRYVLREQAKGLGAR